LQCWDLLLGLFQKLPLVVFSFLDFLTDNRGIKMKFGFTHENEIINGRLAMLGIMLAIASELTTHTITFGFLSF